MTNKILTGAYAGGYTLSHSFTGLVVEASSSVGGTGVVAGFRAPITNYGVIRGVTLAAGGTVTNGSAAATNAMINTGGIVARFAAATVINYGTIVAPIYLRFGGVVTNATSGHIDEAIVVNHAPGVIDNNGTINNGVTLAAGGSVINGSPKDTSAYVYSVVALHASASVANYGLVATGVTLEAGGSVTNGSAGDLAAYMQTVHVAGAVGAVSNLGTISEIRLDDGGTIGNGSVADAAAYARIVDVKGAAGAVSNFGTMLQVTLEAGGSVTNGGSIEGISLFLGGTVINGSAVDTGAQVASIAAQGAAAAVTNFGTIGYGVELAVGGSITSTGSIAGGVRLDLGGAVTNGSASATTARITGTIGVYSQYAATTVTNFGSILGSDFAGVFLSDGGNVTNGSASDTAATISGGYGVYAGPVAAVTVTNFGTLKGTGGFAAYFGSAADQLNVEAGSTFLGAIQGGGGTLNLASGTGTLSAMTSTGNVTVSGSMTTTTFRNFGTVEIAAGASFSDSGPAVVATGHALIDSGTAILGGAGVNSIVNNGLIEAAGTLTLAGAVRNAGTLEAQSGVMTVSGVVSGTGSVIIDDGVADFTSTFSQNVAFAAGSTGVLELSHSLTYRGTVAGLSLSGANALDLGDVAFGVATHATFAGTAAGGTLTVTDGTHVARIRLAGDYLGSTFIVSSDGHGGTTVVDPAAKRGSSLPHIPLAAAMAGFGATAGGATETTAPAWREGRPLLALPGVRGAGGLLSD